MPKGPRGEKRPADVIGNAVRVMKIATGEIEEQLLEGKEYARKGGLKGGPKRAAKLSKERRVEIAREAARTRWHQEKSAGLGAFTVSKSRKTGVPTPKNRSRKS